MRDRTSAWGMSRSWSKALTISVCRRSLTSLRSTSRSVSRAWDGGAGVTGAGGVAFG